MDKPVINLIRLTETINPEVVNPFAGNENRSYSLGSTIPIPFEADYVWVYR